MPFDQANRVQQDMWRLYREHGYVIIDAASEENVIICEDDSIKWIDVGLALNRGEPASDAWYAAAKGELNYFNDDRWLAIPHPSSKYVVRINNQLAIKYTSEILYLAEEALVRHNPAILNSEARVIPAEIINRWALLNKPQLQCLAELLRGTPETGCDEAVLRALTQERIGQLVQMRRQLRMALGKEVCHKILRQMLAGPLNDAFFSAFKAGYDYLESHAFTCCNPFSFHGRHGRDATVTYLTALLDSDRQQGTIVNLMKQWVGNKPWYGKDNASSGARLKSRAAFAWASGLGEITGEEIPDRTLAWARMRPKQREAAATEMRL